MVAWERKESRAMTQTADALIDALGLIPHPEGGAYAETYRHAERVPVRGGRALATAIYFMLREGQVSAWHRVASDELWFYHGGDALTLKQVSPDGLLRAERLGMDLALGERPQRLVAAGHWQAAVPAGGRHGWTLVSCVVAPGFDFSDFELFDEAAMRARFPELGDALGLS
jgi:hypothetical protein